MDDVGRHLAQKWAREHPEDNNEENPWSLRKIAEIKSKFDSDPEGTKKAYPELFYYFDGLLGVKISQSVHPAGMVISPITLVDNYGVFDKDGENCLMLDMENVHDYTGLAKYDFLILKTVQVIRDTCRYIGVPYPKTHEIDWEDKAVWDDMIKSPTAIFQFEGQFAFRSLKKFRPQNIFDMSLVTACIRPTGASYRDELLARHIHKNPSPMIDKLLENNLGYLVYQEDTIAFLQQVCGLSGSQADNIRRAIGRKQKDRLDAAMPSILEGYCSRSDRPREEAEQEAKEFLQVIEDSASYQFGLNHSIAYCLLGYLCAYYRYYHPIEFITSFLNNAANEDDIVSGTDYAKQVGIEVSMPRWGLSRSEYSYDSERKIIAKGLSSIKYMSDGLAEELFSIAHSGTFERFIDVLYALKDSSLRSNQLDILIKIDFFAEFGNQRELLQINELFSDMFKKGDAKMINKSRIDGSPLELIVQKYAVGVTKSGVSSKSYTLLDVKSILYAIEDNIMSQGIDDVDDVTKVKNFYDATGYVGYVSGKDADRRKLYVLDKYACRRRKDNSIYAYDIKTKSIGSGIESRFRIFNSTYSKCKIDKGDIIYCLGWHRDGAGFILDKYTKFA